MKRDRLPAPPAIYLLLSGMLAALSCAAIASPAIGSELSSTAADGSGKPRCTGSVSTLVSKGLAELRANHNAAAAELLKQATVLAPQCAEAHHNLGLALAKLGDTAQGIEQLKLATQLKPELVEAWLTLAGLQQAAGQMQEAIDTYDTYLKRAQEQNRVDATSSIARRLRDELAAELKRESDFRHETDELKCGNESEIQSHSPQSPSASAMLQVPAQTAAMDDYLPLMTNPSVKRWSAARMPLRVFVGDAPWLPQFKHWRDDILLGAFEDWQKAANGKVRFVFVNDPKSADIECYFQPNRNGGSSAQSVEAGEANMSLDTDGVTLVHGKITLITTPLSPILPLTDNRMRLMCLHEIGHALGLAGHTTNPDDIMFYSTTFKDEWRELSGRDARTIQRLYATH